LGKPLAVLLTPVFLSPSNDSGFITIIMQEILKVNGIQVATVGSVCTMVSSSSGVIYPLPIPQGGSTGVKVKGFQVLRMGDIIPICGDVLTIGMLPQLVVSDNFPP
jgi:uncharacterized Zn-binding protein involved in type VI secretion